MPVYQILVIVFIIIMSALLGVVVLQTTRTVSKVGETNDILREQQVVTQQVGEQSREEQSQILDAISAQQETLASIRNASNTQRTLVHDRGVGQVINTLGGGGFIDTTEVVQITQRGVYSLEVDVVSPMSFDPAGFVRYDDDGPQVNNSSVRHIAQEYRTVNEPGTISFKQLRVANASAEIRWRVYRISNDAVTADPESVDLGPFVKLDVAIEIETQYTSIYPGDLVTYTVTGTNTGDAPLNNVRITSTIDTMTRGKIPIVSTDEGTGMCSHLAVGESCQLVGTYIVRDEDHTIDGRILNESIATSDEIEQSLNQPGAGDSAQLINVVLSPHPSMIPVTLNFIQVGDRQITVQFTDSNVIAANVDRYEIAVVPTMNALPPGLFVVPAQYVAVIGRNQSPFTVPHLTNGVEYEVRMRPINTSDEKGPEAFAVAGRPTIRPLTISQIEYTKGLTIVTDSQTGQEEKPQLSAWRARNKEAELTFELGDTIDLTTGYPGGNDNQGTLSTFRERSGVIGLLSKGVLGTQGEGAFVNFLSSEKWDLQSIRYANRNVNKSVFSTVSGTLVDLRTGEQIGPDVQERETFGQNSIWEYVFAFDSDDIFVPFSGDGNHIPLNFYDQLVREKAVPNLWTVSLRCDGATGATTFGYNMGDEIDLSSYIDSSDPQKAITTYVTEFPVPGIGLKIATPGIRTGGGLFQALNIDRRPQILINRKDEPTESALAFGSDDCDWSIVFRVWPDAPLVMGKRSVPKFLNETITFPHGLGAIPNLWRVTLRIVDFPENPPAGDETYLFSTEIDVTGYGWNHRSDWIQSVWADEVNIYVRNVSPSQISMVPRNRTNARAQRINPEKWEYVFRAW